MKNLRFYKTPMSKLWFLDSQEYIEAGGDPRELQMVAGADEFLDILSNNGREVNIEITYAGERESSIIEDTTPQLIRQDHIPNQIGKHYRDKESGKLMWLCPVTLFVFGQYPSVIKYKLL